MFKQLSRYCLRDEISFSSSLRHNRKAVDAIKHLFSFLFAWKFKIREKFYLEIVHVHVSCKQTSILLVKSKIYSYSVRYLPLILILFHMTFQIHRKRWQSNQTENSEYV